MKLALLPLSVAALAVSFSLLTGCAAPTDEGSAPPPSGAATGTESTEDEVRSSDLAGTYKANTDDDSYDKEQRSERPVLQYTQLRQLESVCPGKQPLQSQC
jgi:hypothetical protein